MDDCIGFNCNNDGGLIGDYTGYELYWRLAAIFSSICSFFSISIVLYFLVIRQHPDRPDETDDNEQERFSNMRSHNGNNLFNEIIQSIHLNLFSRTSESNGCCCCSWNVGLKNIFKNLANNVLPKNSSRNYTNSSVSFDASPKYANEKVCLSKNYDDKETTVPANSLPKYQTETKASNNIKHQQSSKKHESKSKNVRLKTSSLNEVQDVEKKRCGKQVKKSNDGSCQDKINRTFRIGFPDTEQFTSTDHVDFDRLEFDIRKPYDYFDNKLADAYGKMNYILNDNLIAIMVYSILNQSNSIIYDVCFTITLMYEKKMQKIFLSNSKVDEILPKSEIAFMETFLVQLDVDQISLDSTEMFVVIAGRCVNVGKKSKTSDKLKILRCIRVKGSELQAVSNIEYFKGAGGII